MEQDAQLMPKRRPRTHRPARAWMSRGLAAIIAVAIGYVSTIRSLAYVIRMGAVEQAHKLAPDDGRITALLAQSRLGNRDISHADEAARQALLQDATTAAAASSLAIYAQARNDPARARRLISYADRLSRRELQTQLWMIEDAVRRGDVGAALQQYDIALRTSSVAPNLLFPVLVPASAKPEIRRALVGTLKANPPWREAFLDYLSANNPDPKAWFETFEMLHQASVPVSAQASTRLIGALIAAGSINESWSYYASIRPGVARTQSRDAMFAADARDASPFDWNPVNDAGIAASVQKSEPAGVFDFAVSPSLSGTLLWQVEALPPGRYRLDGVSAHIEQPMESRPFWMLICHGGRELGRAFLPNSAEAHGAFSGTFTVPADCPLQTLSLVAQPSDALGGVVGQIVRARLHPAA